MELKTKSTDKLKVACASCGKPIDATLAGAVTGWLFRTNCQCKDSAVELVPAKPEASVVGDDESSLSAVKEQLAEEGFELISLIGEGGMGSVYKARNKALDKIFAIKVLRPEFVKDRRTVKRFEQEVEAAGDLTHPNLVAVYNHGVIKDGAPYLVMDYLEGESLAALIQKEGYLGVQRALNIFLEITDAVAHAHMKGIVHRDLKPSNIILSRTEGGADLVKIVDFGIAKLRPDRGNLTQDLTQTGEIFGSPFYMSPEQCTGEKLDYRSDIYSFGCVMFETLTGKPPFRGANPVQTILKHLNETPPALSGLTVPDDLAYIVLRCLEKNPADRYQSAHDVERDLRRVRDGKPVQRAAKVARAEDKRLRIAGAGMLLGAMTVGLIAFAAIAWMNSYSMVKNDVKSAVSQLQKSDSHLVTSDAGSDSWLVKQGLAYHELNQFDKAIDCFNKALEVNPKSAHAYAGRARAYNRKGQLHKAIEDASAAIKIDPNFTSPYLRRAWAYSQTGRSREAIADCTKAIEIDPSCADAYANRSIAYYDIGDLAQVLRDCNRAIELDPSNHKSYLNRACALKDLGRNEEAVRDCTKAIMLDPGDSGSYVTRGAAYIDLGRYKEAIDDASKAISMDPKIPEAYNNRGVAYNLLGRHDLAAADWSMAAKLKR